MKLYLSSHQCGNAIGELFSLLGTKNPRTIVITNAADFHDDDTLRSKSTRNELDRLKEHGIIAKELDLRNYFVDNKNLHKVLESADLVWVRGGNTFLLRRALALSGADQIIANLIRQDKITYGGHSAGVAVLGPTLDGIEIVDDQNCIPAPYSTCPVDETILMSGLDVIKYQVAPHYKSNFLDSAKVDSLISYYKRVKRSYIALKDGQVLIVDGKKERILGK